MKFTRRRFLLLSAVVVGGAFGVAWLTPHPAMPDGWKSEHWEAGFGSWGSGGYGVAYDIQMPKEYDFSQKCGTAWIADGTDGPEFAVRLSFAPNPATRLSDFQDYLSTDGPRNYDVPRTAIRLTAPTEYAIGPEAFARTNIHLDHARWYPEADGEPAKFGPVDGFWLDGSRLSVIADLRDARRAAIDERIVASLQRSRGWAFFDLIGGGIPFLNGC
jgi:hypothetical protein